jgi:chemotaxis regulatin CheY-phosphate phosphatase CheZ
MQVMEIQPEINSLQNQLSSLTEKFDLALSNNVNLGDAKKLFHEMRILQARIEVLSSENSPA